MPLKCIIFSRLLIVCALLGWCWQLGSTPCLSVQREPQDSCRIGESSLRLGWVTRLSSAWFLGRESHRSSLGTSRRPCHWERPQNVREEGARCYSQSLWVELVGWLDLSHSCASILCLVSKPPGGPCDVCAFSQLGGVAGKLHGWQGRGRALALCGAGRERGNVLSARRAQSHLKETTMVSRWSWQEDKKAVWPQSWPHCLVSVDDPNKHLISFWSWRWNSLLSTWGKLWKEREKQVDWKLRVSRPPWPGCLCPCSRCVLPCQCRTWWCVKVEPLEGA